MPSRGLILLAAAAVVLCAGAAATGQPARGAGSFRDCPHCPEMVPVAPGGFAMGDEQPPRRVTIEDRFAYSQDKVSFRDWKHCVLASVCQSLGASTASLEPVVQVSWVDVQQYLSWLSLETGAEYRLLSEAEWEYLARRPAPGVRADGLEWVSDCWHASYAGAPTDGSSWDTDGDCRYHVARGRRPGEAAPPVTKRFRFLFDARDAALGFRVARTIRP
jgi:formylglycine-generating enzyme required for sulfatase activity